MRTSIMLGLALVGLIACIMWFRLYRFSNLPSSASHDLHVSGGIDSGLVERSESRGSVGSRMRVIKLPSVKKIVTIGKFKLKKKWPKNATP